MKPLLIGQAPGQTPGEPLSGRAGQRLSALCGLTLEQFLDRFDRMNLLEEFPGKSGKGDAFPIKEARANAQALTEVVAARHLIILLGHRVADAFGLYAAFFEPTKFFRDGGDVYVVPHPSGINVWWNDPLNVLEARTFFRRLILD